MKITAGMTTTKNLTRDIVICAVIVVIFLLLVINHNARKNLVMTNKNIFEEKEREKFLKCIEEHKIDKITFYSSVNSTFYNRNRSVPRGYKLTTNSKDLELRLKWLEIARAEITNYLKQTNQKCETFNG